MPRGLVVRSLPFYYSPWASAPSTTEPVLAQAGTQGSWRTLSNQVPINPVHAALLRNGQVLMVAGSGNVATETNFRATVWDPATETFLTQALAWDMFCNGMVTLHDGRVLVNGGNLQYDPFFGEPRNAVFDPATGLFTDIENMAHGRWYPTVTTLGDGRVMTFSGLLEDRRHEYVGRNLYRGFGLESAVPGRLDAASLSAHAPEHGRSRVLCRVGRAALASSILQTAPGQRLSRPLITARRARTARPCSCL